MKLTNKEYLVDIILKTIQVKHTKQPSKISCEVHYDDNYFKMKLQPTIKNGIANFLEERITIPYSPDLALVFKMLKNDKKEVFLGHYPLELEKYLKEKNFFIEIKGEALEETDAKVTFDCRIIDKALFNSDSDEIEEDEMGSIINKETLFSSQEMKFARKPLTVKYQSEAGSKNRGLLFTKKHEEFNVLLDEEFFTQLENVKEIIKKKESFNNRENIKALYSRDEDGFLRSEKIIELENRLLKLREEERLGNFLIYSLISGVAFVFGFMYA